MREKVPSFLADFAEEIFLCGKYLNVIKEFDSSIGIPGHLVRPLHTESFDLNSDFIRESVREVYAWANDALMEIVREKMHLREGFMAVKHFFFGDCGDLVLHFMDLARDELKKSGLTRLLYRGARQTAELSRAGAALFGDQRRPVQAKAARGHVQVHALGHALRALAAQKGALTSPRHANFPSSTRSSATRTPPCRAATSTSPSS